MLLLLGSYNVLVFNKTRGKKHGHKQYQINHHRAKESLRIIWKGTAFTPVLDRFQADTWYRSCQSEQHVWTESYCRDLDYIAQVDFSHKASYALRTRYEQSMHMKCGESNQLGPMRKRDDCHRTTKALVSLAAQTGRLVENIPKESRFRLNDTFDPKLEQDLDLAGRHLAYTLCRSWSLISQFQFIRLMEVRKTKFSVGLEG